MDDGGGVYTVSCTPLQVGIHSLSLQWNGLDIPNSPILISSCDPSKCKMEGVPKDGTFVIQKGAQNTGEITIDTKEAGKGEIEEISSEPSCLSTKLEKIDEGRYKLTLTARKITTAPVKVDIKFCGIPIPDSPLTVNVCDIEQIYVEPANIPTTRVNEIIDITIHTENAGYGSLEVEASDPQGIKTELVNDGGGVYRASCTPLQVGSHPLSIYWSGMEIPISPVTISSTGKVVGIPISSTGKVVGIPEDVLTLQKGPQNQKVITITTEGAEKREFCVVSSDPSRVLTEKEQTSEDTFKVIIIPQYVTKAPVRVDFLYGGAPLQGSPLAVNVCNAEGVYIEPSELPILFVGEPLKITVYTEEAGKGELQVKAYNASLLKVEVEKSESDSYTLSCTPLEVGTHCLTLCWNHFEVPCSPLALTACDPSKCIVKGFPKEAKERFNVSVDIKKAGKGKVTAEVEYDDKSIEECPVKHENSKASFTIIDAVAPRKKLVRVKFNGRQIDYYEINKNRQNRWLCTCMFSFLVVLLAIAIALHFIYFEHSSANKYI